VTPVLHLLVPGLFGPAPRGAGRAPRLPNIERLLARGDRGAGPPGYAEALFKLFGQAAAAGEDLPTAALCLARETGSAGEGWVMHADPVHLRPDQDRLLLFDARSLELAAEEAAALVERFNRHFAADGLRIEAPAPGRWYLHSDSPPGVCTTTLDEVTGRNIDAYLPSGPRARFWRGVLNETQMLFHDHPVNTAREEAGRQPVSGVWLSGGGRKPARGATRVARLVGGDLLAEALAGDAELVPAGNDELVVERTVWEAMLAVDVEAWLAALVEFDRHLGSWLDSDRPLRLYACDRQVIDWQRSMRWRFWRRVRPFAGYLG
jgi:hypothetical protein